MVYALTNWTVLFKVLKIWIKCRWNKKAVNKRTTFSIGGQMLTHAHTQWTSSCVTIYLLYYWMLLQILFCIIPHETFQGNNTEIKHHLSVRFKPVKDFRLEDASSNKYFMIVHLSYAICIILGVYTSLLTKVSTYSNIIEFPAKQCRDTEVNSTKQPADRQENCPVWVLQDKRRCWQRWNWSLCWNKSPYTWSTLLIISMAELVWQSVVDHMAPCLMSAQASPCWAKAGHGLVGLLSKDFEHGHHHEGSVVCAPSLTLAGVSGHKWLQVSSVSEQFKFTTEKTLLCSNQFIITDSVYSKITLS